MVSNAKSSTSNLMSQDNNFNLTHSHIHVIFFIRGKCYTNFLELHDTDATFSILQDDEFRQLTYLSLRMRAGNDAAIKGYLSTELKNYKLQCASLEQELSKTTDNLSRQLNEMQIRVEHLSKREIQLESEKSETLAQQKHYFYDQIQELKDAHERRLQDECQKLILEHRSEIERLQQRQTQLENTVNPLTSENKQLTESKLRTEAENASLNAQLSTLREESEVMKKEISRLVSSNAMLSSKNNENTSAITSDKVLISRLQQQTEDQGERIKDLQNALESEKQSVSVLQDHLKELNNKLDRAKEREKHLIKEITKGNSIIQKHEMKFAKQIKRRDDMKMALLQTETVLKNALQQQRNAENENERLIEKMSASREKVDKLQDTLQSKIDELKHTKQILEREKETNRTLAEELRYQKSRDFKSSMYSGFSSSMSGVTRSGIGDFRTRQTSVRPTAKMISGQSVVQRSPRGGANHDTAESLSSNTMQYSTTTNDNHTESAVQGSSLTNEGTGMTAFKFTKQFDDNGTYVGGKNVVRTAASQQRHAQHNSETWDRNADADNGKVFFDVSSAHNKRFH